MHMPTYTISYKRGPDYKHHAYSYEINFFRTLQTHKTCGVNHKNEAILLVFSSMIGCCFYSNSYDFIPVHHQLQQPHFIYLKTVDSQLSHQRVLICTCGVHGKTVQHFMKTSLYCTRDLKTGTEFDVDFNVIQYFVTFGGVLTNQ